MKDERIKRYTDLARAMGQGKFDISIPSVSEGDDIADLGVALKELSDILEEKFDEMHRIASITEKINAGLMLDEVLSHLYDTFHSLIPYNRIGLALIDEDGDTIKSRWQKSDGEVLSIDVGYSASLAQSSLKKIIDTRQPRIINDLVQYGSMKPESESTRRIVEEGMRSSLTCPLVAIDKPVGFLFFTSRETGAYRNAHVEVFMRIAGQLSVIVEKSRLYQQLMELNELKNRFLGIAAHDLRSPIAVIKNYVDLFTKGYLGDIDDQQRNIMERMDKSCGQMLAMINDLLDVTAIEAGKLELNLEEVDMLAFLRDAYENARLLAGTKNIEVVFNAPSALPGIKMDMARMTQVVNNLITNAIKFSHSNTRITITASADDELCMFSVADQGQGIPESEMPKLFAPFGKTKVRPTDGEKSTGLGLAIVKKMVEAHRGHIEVMSEEGKGTTFSVHLPLVSG